MVDPITARTWGYRALYLGVMLTLAFVQLLPLGPAAGRWPGPDLGLALTFAWVLRRPAYVPAPLIAGLFLFLDLMLQRPPGLGTALVLLGSEFLRARRDMSRTLPFTAEWMLVSVVLVALAGANQLALAVVMASPPPLGLALLRAVFTAATYPLVVLLSHYVLGVRSAAPNEADALGNRL